MSFDFRADQVRTGRIISSGSLPLLIYPSSSAANLEGGLSQFSTASIGTDVFLYVSGSNSKLSVFGGDVRVSGSITGSIGTVDGTNAFITGSGIIVNINSLKQFELTGALPREGALTDRGLAVDHRAGFYFVNTGSSQWTLWHSIPINDTWTWVQHIYHQPVDTISTGASMLADWDFSALTTAATIVTNSISPGTGNLAVGATIRSRLQAGIADASWPTTGLQALLLTATGDESPSTGLDLNAAGTLFEPVGDWTVAIWVARNTAFNFSTGNGCIAIMKRRTDATWGGPSDFSAVSLGVGNSLMPQAYVAQGGAPTFTEINGTDAIPPGRLVLLTLTFVTSSGTLSLYMDNRLAASTTGLGAISWGAGASRSWCVGGNIAGSGVAVRQTFPGWIGRAQIANIAVTAADIARHIAFVSGRT